MLAPVAARSSAGVDSGTIHKRSGRPSRYVSASSTASTVHRGWPVSSGRCNSQVESTAKPEGMHSSVTGTKTCHKSVPKPSAAVAAFAVTQAAIGARSSFSPGQASLGPDTEVPSGRGARRTRPHPRAHTHSPRVSLVCPRAHDRQLGVAAVGLPPAQALQCKHVSVVCCGAAWAPHTLSDTSGCRSCRQAPQGRSSSAPIQVSQGGRPRPRSAMCGLRSCSRQRGAHPQAAPLALRIPQNGYRQLRWYSTTSQRPPSPFDTPAWSRPHHGHLWSPEYSRPAFKSAEDAPDVYVTAVTHQWPVWARRLRHWRSSRPSPPQSLSPRPPSPPPPAPPPLPPPSLRAAVGASTTAGRPGHRRVANAPAAENRSGDDEPPDGAAAAAVTGVPVPILPASRSRRVRRRRHVSARWREREHRLPPASSLGVCGQPALGRAPPSPWLRGVWLGPWASPPIRAPRGGDVATLPPVGAAVTTGSRSSGERAGGVVVLCLLLCVAAGFLSLSCTPAVTAAKTAWAAANAAAAESAATVPAVSLSASGWMGCGVRRGERRKMVFLGNANGATMPRTRR